MKGENYAPDTFTELDVIQQLRRAELRYYVTQRYILSQCPLHDDENPSVQIYKDDWFVQCHAGCGRFHITKAFPDLRGIIEGHTVAQHDTKKIARTKVTKHEYKQFDLMDTWKLTPLIPDSYSLHGVPASVLNDLGWRQQGSSILIPYFSRTKTTIPFAQWRHSIGTRRFTMLKDAKPTCYGTWNLMPGEKIFIVEGTSDCAVLFYAGVSFIGLPSAASTALVVPMADFCQKNDIRLVYAGDNDAAGDKLREALDTVAPYRLHQPPKEYKDWGAFLEKTDIETVMAYLDEELNPKVAKSQPLTVKDIWPGATEIKNESTGVDAVRSDQPVLPLPF